MISGVCGLWSRFCKDIPTSSDASLMRCCADGGAVILTSEAECTSLADLTLSSCFNQQPLAETVATCSHSSAQPGVRSQIWSFSQSDPQTPYFNTPAPLPGIGRHHGNRYRRCRVRVGEVWMHAFSIYVLGLFHHEQSGSSGYWTDVASVGNGSACSMRRGRHHHAAYFTSDAGAGHVANLVAFDCYQLDQISAG